MSDKIEKHLGVYRRIPSERTFTLLVSKAGSGKPGSPLGKVRDHYGEEFDVVDRVTGESQHVSLAHLRNEDPETTMVAWQWSFKAKRPLTSEQADDFLAHVEQAHPGVTPKPEAKDHLMGPDR